MEQRIATSNDVPRLLDWMEDFNHLETIAWTRERGEPALRTLLADSRLGWVGIFEDVGAPVSYFVLTWGYDLEWNGRDAYLTELFLVPEVRGRRLGVAALALLEEVARGNGARALHLMVLPDNAPA